MPESSKTTLLELAARYLSGGASAVMQRYPEQKHFLLILPENGVSPPIVWTSSHPSVMRGNTTLTKLDIKKVLDKYTFPNAVVTSIKKSNRNSHPYVIVGRSDSADIILNSQQISKNHAAVYLGDKLQIRDLHSTNGTFIDEASSLEGVCGLESWTEVKFGDVRTLYTNLNDLLSLIQTVEITDQN